eukprot:CAMPEP_0172850156 /NCGR_PEP_ID=MMETSP1075-20121228/47888_1 /TAXON_ID=2916 /ORGANISM="Ceratium fusus, Strain PA161109" /LENGTH=70 /DNA_ID=CAMNT_0013695891 /DNA_START=44 /DNA_END=256 /DNA_ORIENTATION=+
MSHVAQHFLGNKGAVGIHGVPAVSLATNTTSDALVATVVDPSFERKRSVIEKGAAVLLQNGPLELTQTVP